MRVIGVLALIALGANAASAATELTKDNFDDTVYAPKTNAFVKFLAPW